MLNKFREKIKKLMQNRIFTEFVLITSTMILSFLMAISVEAFLVPAGLYASGITGASQVLSNIFCRISGKMIPYMFFVFTINVPIFIYGFLNVSKRFIIYSTVSLIVALTSPFLWHFYLRKAGCVDNIFGPLKVFYQTLGVNFYVKDKSVIFQALSVYGKGETPAVLTSRLCSMLILVLVSGVLMGVCTGLSLRIGSSTAGVDIIAQGLSIKKNKSVGGFMTVFNICVSLLGGFTQLDRSVNKFIEFSIIIFFFSAIRNYISGIITDLIHTKYNYRKLNIVVSNIDEIMPLIIEFDRGCTKFRVEGAYSNDPKYNLIMVAYEYEIPKLVEMIKTHDSSAFIYVEPVKKVIGNYKRRAIL